MKNRSMLSNPFRELTKNEWLLWGVSLVVVLLSNIMAGRPDLLNLAAVVTGVTLLIFLAKGNVWGQILTVVFSIFYGLEAQRFHYWGEMVTYLGMTGPMAFFAALSWLKHPDKDRHAVQIGSVSPKMLALTLSLTALVTILFYFILSAFQTPNILFSTLSVFTSFLACMLTFLRSPWYAAAYAGNDLILIILWVLASVKDPIYIPMVANFIVFLINDLYGLVCWRKRAAGQASS